MAERIITSADDFKALVGKEVGVSRWLEVTQERVNRFAEATDDHQWIHTDPVRAKTESPYGGTIAHGYLTISLTPSLISEIAEVKNLKMGVNYGLDKLRFPAPVPVGSRVRVRLTLKKVREIGGAIQTTQEVVVEVEGQQKPACVAQTLSLYYFAD